MASHAGAARFAYNAGLAHVKETLDGGETADLSHYALRRWWNANKDVLAVNRDTGVVWWNQNSKEAYSMALRELAQGFSNWSSHAKVSVKARGSGSLSSSPRILLCVSRIPRRLPPQRLMTLTG